MINEKVMVTDKIGNNLGVRFSVSVIIISILLCFIRDVIILSILDRVTGWLEIILAARIRNQGKDTLSWGETKRIFWLFRGKNNLCCWLIDGKTGNVTHKDVMLCPRRSWENRELSFSRKSSGECNVHGCINPKLPFCASRLNFSNEKDWTFKWKPEMKDSTTALLLLSPNLTLHSSQPPIMVQSLCIEPK